MFYTNIKSIQIEHSSICNAKCPQCLREWWGGDYSRFKQTYIPTEFYEERIPQHIYNSLNLIDFCGSIGDPCAAPNFIETIQVVKKKNPNTVISIATNGGMKNEDWWVELAKNLSVNDSINFGIDGLEDTNHIYRKNVNWKKLISNVSSFISAGGKANWQFIPFSHNEHQIDEAKELSKKLGFNNFFTIYNDRFASDKLFSKPDAIGGDGKILMPPKKEEELSVVLREGLISYDINQWKRDTEKDIIECQSKKFSEVYIDVETHLFPCCNTAASRYGVFDLFEDGYTNLWSNYGKDKIKLSLHDWDDILNGDFYNNLRNSWTKKFNEGRVIVCSGICSIGKTRFTQYRNTK